ncbi:MAG TPA: heme ABC exporter ATP-binding protein CcmA [Vicinamibacterales bacterium]|nr:heme ABC exporter ATP-binding protein CcmA [Vicinamibacterales bacterium]
MISASHLTRRFGTRVALDDLSIELKSGEIFALLGPNGAGKTTTLRLLAGLIAPTSGSVQVNGEAMTAASASKLRARIGFLTEAPGLWDSLTVRENLEIYARLYELAAPRRAVDEALALFDIRDRARDRPSELSKGLRQRVALARSLLHKPRIVLLDEPTAGLDPESAREVRELVLGLRGEGRTVLLCTHNLDEVDRVADRVAVLRTRLIAAGTPQALRERLFAPRILIRLRQEASRFEASLRGTGITDITIDQRQISVALNGTPLSTPDLVRQLVQWGAEIEAVVPEEPPLEDVYVRLLHSEGAGQ